VAKRRSAIDETGPLEKKWRIVEEAQLPGSSIAEVTRRRGVNSNLLFRWIRASRGRKARSQAGFLVLLPQPTLDSDRRVGTRR
jgi:transposase